MKFSTTVEQVLELLQRQQRISYRALKREFDLDDEYIEDLKAEIIQAKRLARDEDGTVLVWTGEGAQEEPENRGNSEKSLESSVQSLESESPRPQMPSLQMLDPRRRTLDSAAERRQLTVMFCDLVGSTALSEQLDPEELREVVRAYQHLSAEVISRFEGHIAQYLGDGLLVYFGYPLAHEDDAQRAVRAGLGIIQALQTWVPSPLAGEGQGEGTKDRALQVRIGIHTGQVVVGEMGGGGKREQLALGDTPNIAARLQGLAEPNTVVISAATYRLSAGFFACRSLGPTIVKGISVPVEIYQALEESGIQSRFEVASRTGLTPLVGREQEVMR
jgi:class 3 adenylate cyclase